MSSWQDALKAVGVQDAPKLPKRFYKAVQVEPTDTGFAILLDGKALRTPTRLPIILQDGKIAEELAREWAAQGEFITPSTMPLTRLVNSALSAVADRRPEVLAEITRFAGSDLTCYRAASPSELVALQAAAFDDVLEWAQQQFGSAFAITDGVAHIVQAPERLTNVAAHIENVVGDGAAAALRLAALGTMTSLTGSALIPLHCLAGGCTLQAAWDKAHVDEDYQIGLWGEDEEAQQRRAARWSEMQAAGLVLGIAA